jgi:hypothetical protein
MGLYHRHLSRYLTHFPRAALPVLIYEELICGTQGSSSAGSAIFLGPSLGWSTADQLLAQRIKHQRDAALSARFRLGPAHWRVPDAPPPERSRCSLPSSSAYRACSAGPPPRGCWPGRCGRSFEPTTRRISARSRTCSGARSRHGMAELLGGYRARPRSIRPRRSGLQRGKGRCQRTTPRFEICSRRVTGSIPASPDLHLAEDGGPPARRP